MCVQPLDGLLMRCAGELNKSQHSLRMGRGRRGLFELCNECRISISEDAEDYATSQNVTTVLMYFFFDCKLHPFSHQIV